MKGARRTNPEGSFDSVSGFRHGIFETFLREEPRYPKAFRRGEEHMSTVVKVIEVIAQSEKSFDDAAQSAVKEVAKTVKNIKSVWIDNFSGTVQGDRITEYRVNAKVSFVVEGHK
jgi:hypothetical protein